MVLRISMFLIISVFFTVLAVVSAGLQVKFAGCYFNCANYPCGIEPAPTKKGIPTINGYYWRDFDGTIPKDAFPTYDDGKPTKPKTYVGQAYYKEDNSVYTTTIVEGMNSVNIPSKAGVVKTSEFVQILCTQELDKFSWTRLTEDAIINHPISSGHENGSYYRQQFVVRSKSMGIYYASSILDGDSNATFATMGGTSKETPAGQYEFLNYNSEKGETPSNTSQPQSTGNASKTSTLFNLPGLKVNGAMNSSTIISCLYQKIATGECSYSCPKQGSSKKQKNLEYYWTPISLPPPADGLSFGNDSSGKTIYAAKTWSEYGVDVGQTTGRFVFVVYGDAGPYGAISQFFGQILTVKKGKYKWVPSNATQFKTMDMSNMIQGGLLSDGIKTYVGRIKNGENYLPASIRLYNNGSALAWGWRPRNLFSSDFDAFMLTG